MFHHTPPIPGCIHSYSFVAFTLSHSDVPEYACVRHGLSASLSKRMQPGISRPLVLVSLQYEDSAHVCVQPYVHAIFQHFSSFEHVHHDWYAKLPSNNGGVRQTRTSVDNDAS